MRTLIICILTTLIAQVAKCQETDNYSQYAYPITNVDSLLKANRHLLLLPEGCETEGMSHVTFIVTIDGGVKDIETIRGLENCPKADSIAIEIVKKFRYSPEIEKGKHIEVRKA